MSDGFTNKEMLVRILNKLDTMEDKLIDTHDLALKTNGKVKFHTKLIWGLWGLILTLTGWVVKNII